VLIKVYDVLSFIFKYDMEGLILINGAACLTVLIGYQITALCIDAHLLGDLPLRAS